MADKTPVKQACTKIADLSIQHNEQKWKICARVIRKSEKKWTDTNRVYFKVMLEDDTAKIEALVFSETNVKRLYPELEIKKVYYISNGSLKQVNKNYQSVGHDYEIYLDHTTTVVSCTNSADHPGNSPYTPIRELSSSQSALIDTIGKLTMIGPLEMIISKGMKKPLRNIQLIDRSDDTTVPVALWGKQATEFKGIPLGRVISVRNVTVNTYQGNQVLYSTVNTLIDYNPTNMDALRIRNHNCCQGGEITSTKKSEETTLRAGSSGLAQVRRKILVEDTLENMPQESRTNSEEMSESESATHVFANLNFTTTISNISDVENHGSWDVNDVAWIEDVITTNDLTRGVDSEPEMPLTLQNNSEVRKSNPEFQKERKRRSDSELGPIMANEAKKKNKWEKHEMKDTPKHLADYRQLNQVPDAFENDPMAIELFERALRDGKEKDIFRRVNIVGNYKQGKTSLLHQLLNQSTDGVTSTNGVVVKNCYCFRSSDGEVIFIPKETDDLNFIKRLAVIAVRQKDVEQQLQDANYRLDMDDNLNGEQNESSVFNAADMFENTQPSIEDQRSTLFAHTSNGHTNQDSPKSNSHDILLTNEEKLKFVSVVRTPSPDTHNGELQPAITFWDFGGQFVFYATHALFHSRKAVYLLVFDMTIPLNQAVDDNEYPIQGEKKSMRYYLEFWLNSIHSFVGSEDGSEPIVVLVGTHADQIDIETKDKYIAEVRGIFKELGVVSHIYPVDFAVDNTMFPYNPEVVALREKIWELTEDSCKSIEIPAKWMQLEKQLDKKRNEKVIHLSEVQKIDSTSSISLNDIEQIKLFLRYHHEKGTYIYFDEPGLSNYVIVEPQFLVDAFKSIITCERFFTNYPEVVPLWTKLQSEARLEQSLIDIQWSKDKTNTFMINKDVLICFLIRHHIISEATRYDEDSNKTERLGWYVVPSLLREITEEDKQRAAEFVKPKPKTVLKFVMKFKISTIVQLVFHRLLAAIIDKWSVVELKAKPTDRQKRTMIFQNLCIINLPEHHAGIAELKGNFIELSVINTCSSSRVKCEQASRFRRFSESVVTHEFRKFKQHEEMSKPYSILFRCNDFCHGFSGSLETLDTQDLDKGMHVPCPDHDTHNDIKTKTAKEEWFPGIQKSVPGDDFHLTDNMLVTIAQMIGKNWQFLGLALGLSQVDIDHLEEENRNNLVMKIYKMLLKWKVMSETPTFNKLLAAMEKCADVTFDWDSIENFRDDILG